MNTLIWRYKWWLMLAVLLAINLVIYAPWKKKVANRRPGGPPPGMQEGRPPEPTAEMKAKMEERLAKMTPEERQAFEARRKADREFFDSIKGLSESERREKMREYMAKNPPPFPPDGQRGPGGPGGPGGPPPSGMQGDTASGSGSGDGPGGDGPGGDGKVRVPSADQRRGMDSQIVNSQKAGGS